MQHAADFGVHARIRLAFEDVQKRKDKVVMKTPRRRVSDEEELGHGLQGHGAAGRAGKVEVTAEDGKKETVNSKNIIIATGSVVRPIPGFETDGERVVNSDHILELKEVPKSLIVMGAGAVGVEFASVYSRFGCETTLVELLPRLLPLEDEEVSAELAKAFRKRKIKSQVDTKLDGMEKTDRGVVLTGKTSKGEAVNSKPKCCWSPSVGSLHGRARARGHENQVEREPSRSTNSCGRASPACTPSAM